MKFTRFFRNFVFLCSLVGLGSFSYGEIFHFRTSDTNSSEVLSSELFIEANSSLVGDFLSFAVSSASRPGNIYLELKVDSNTWMTLFQNVGFNSSDKLTIHGPATLRYRGTSVNYYGYHWASMLLQYQIMQEEKQAPSKKFATVIPENASGNVRIVLEQSTDLINWSSANPGVFSPSTSKRFFRVRSVEE
jgi:hypothetical protein